MSQPKILIVEDELLVAKDIATLLANQGYEITGIASSAVAAMQSIEESGPDLIIMDVRIEGDQDGIEAASEIRARYDIPVVFLTGYPDQETIDRVKHTAPYGFLAKPAASRSLISSVQIALERHRADRKMRESEQRYRDLFELTSEAVIVVSVEDAAIESVNPQATKLFGYSQEEFGSLPLETLFHPEDRWMVADFRARETQGDAGVQRYNCRMLAQDGTHLWVEVKSLTLEWDGRLFAVAFVQDVTERVVKQRTTEAKHQQLSLIADNIPAMISSVDTNQRYRFVNQAYAENFGMTPDQVVGKHVKDVAGPAIYEIASPYIDKVLSGQPFVFEGEIPLKSGKAWLRVQSVPDRDTDGQVTGFFSVMTDLTEHRKSEEQLRIKDRAMEACLNGIAITDMSGRLTYVNPSFLQMWGHDEERQALGRNATEFWLRPEDASDVITRVVQDGSWTGELTARRQDGSLFDAQLVASLVRDGSGSPLCMLASFYDITDRKTAERQVRESQTMLSQALEAANMGFWDWDLTTGEAVWSDRNHRMLGYEPDEIEPDLKNWKRLVHPDDWPLVSESLNLHMQGQTGAFEVEHRMRNKAGEWQWFHARNKVMEFADDGTPLRMAGVMIDVSARKRSEEAVFESEQRLRAIFEVIPDCVFVKNRDLRYIHVNPALEKLFRKSSRELPDSTDADLFGEEAARHIAQVDERVLQGEVCEEEASKPVNGIPTTFHTIKVPLFGQNGEVTGLCGVARDITERKQAEDSVRQSESKYRLLVETMNDGLVLVDRDFIIRFCNPQAAQMVGYAPDELIGLPAIHLIDEAHQARVRAEWSERTRGLRNRYESLVLAKDGRKVWVRISAGPILTDGKGDFQGIIAVFTDITEQKKAEEALRARERKYRRLFDLSPLGIISCDRHGRVMEVNPKLLQILGSPSADATKAINVLEFPPLRESGFAGAFERCMATGESLSFEAPYVSAWGHEASLRVVLNPIFEDAEVQGLQAVVEDVTEAKAVEAELYLKALVLDQIQDFVTITDLSGTITYVNRALINSLQRTPQELLGFSAEVFGKQPESQGIHGEIREQTLRDGSWDGEIVCSAKDGSTIVVALRTMVVRDHTGKPICLCGFGTDITERKKLQALGLQAEKYKAVADLSAGVAHNFNNLLQIVIGNTELALMDIRSGEYESLDGKLTEIRNASRFGAETVRRLNRFVRQADPGEKEENLVFDLSEAVQTVVTMGKPLWSDEPKKKGLSVKLDCRLDQGCTIRGRRSELFELMLNLIKNAVEALPEGGDIEIDTVRENDEVVLRVRDTGIGIPAGNINRLFTPFFTTSVEAGRGLGLSTCRSIVGAHGGTILVESSEGEGTTFTVRLPFAPPEPDTPDRPESVKALQPLHILAIDDMEGTVTLLKSGLGKMGHVVLTALSGDQGLALLEDNPVDVVICDLGMPGMNGWQVGEAITRRCSAKGLPKPGFIILTGWGGQSSEKQKIATSGVDAVLEKPVDIAKLLDVISDVTDKA